MEYDITYILQSQIDIISISGNALVIADNLRRKLKF